MPRPHARLQTRSSDAPIETILIVEDDVLVRFVLADYLRGCGYKVFEADSVADAKAVLNADTPVDLVFTDVNLRGEENGFVLARWIREHHPNTQVLLASGVGNAAEKAGELCDDGTMLKPYTPQAVLRRIQELLRKAGAAGAQ